MMRMPSRTSAVCVIVLLMACGVAPAPARGNTPAQDLIAKTVDVLRGGLPAPIRTLTIVEEEGSDLIGAAGSSEWASRLEGALQASGRFNVVTSRRFTDIKGECVSRACLADPEALRRIARERGVDAIVIGRLLAGSVTAGQTGHKAAVQAARFRVIAVDGPTLLWAGDISGFDQEAVVALLGDEPSTALSREAVMGEKIATWASGAGRQSKGSRTTLAVEYIRNDSGGDCDLYGIYEATVGALARQTSFKLLDLEWLQPFLKRHDIWPSASIAGGKRSQLVGTTGVEALLRIAVVNASADSIVCAVRLISAELGQELAAVEISASAEPGYADLAKLISGVGPLRVNSTPAGAQVFLDGSAVGTTPCDVHLANGPHTMIVKKDYFREESRFVTTEHQQAASLDIALRQAGANLRIQTNPPRADIELDGRSVGVAPLELADISMGPHRVVARTNYSAVSRDFVINTRDYELDLELPNSWRKHAVLRSFMLPGLGQQHKHQRTRGWAYTIAFAGSAGLALASNWQKESAADDYAEARARFDAANDAAATRAALSDMNSHFSDYESLARQRNVLMYAGAGVWLVALLDSILSQPADAHGLRIGSPVPGQVSVSLTIGLSGSRSTEKE